MNSKFNARKKLALVTLALGALAQPALATENGDFKVYPASMCVPEGAPGNPNFQIAQNGGGIITNTSTTSELNVVCPIVRDNVTASTFPGQANPTKVKVFFLDQNPTSGIFGSIRCTLFSRNSDGNVVASSLTRSDNPTNEFGGMTTQRLAYQDGILDGLGGRGYMQLQCILPKAVVDSTGLKKVSGIRAYEVRENLTDTLNAGFVDQEL